MVEPTNPLHREQYVQLKEEQRVRMGLRDGLIKTTYGALGATVAFSAAVNNPAGSLVLLVVPLVAFTLGWTFLRNNVKIMTIGWFIAETYPECSWETYRVEVTGRRRRKYLQLMTDLIVFVLTGQIALVLFWMQPQRILWDVVSGIEWVMLAVLGTEFIRSSDGLYRKNSVTGVDKV